MLVLLWYIDVSFLISLISISLEGSSYRESTVFRIPQAQISQISNFLTWGNKQLGTAKKQTDTTQTNSASTTSKWSIEPVLYSKTVEVEPKRRCMVHVLSSFP